MNYLMEREDTAENFYNTEAIFQFWPKKPNIAIHRTPPRKRRKQLSKVQPVKKLKQRTLFESDQPFKRSKRSIEGKIIHEIHNLQTTTKLELQEAELSFTKGASQPQGEGGCNLGQGALRAPKFLLGTTTMY
jgi:hypothetical protein